MQKKIEDLTFIDDGMFQAVMHEPGISEKVVENLLHIKVEKIVYPEQLAIFQITTMNKIPVSFIFKKWKYV